MDGWAGKRHTGFDMVAVYVVGKQMEIKHAGNGKASPYRALWGRIDAGLAKSDGGPHPQGDLILHWKVKPCSITTPATRG